MAWHWEGGVMVFSPTYEEFQDFPAFIAYMEEQGAHHCGLAKVNLCVDRFDRLLDGLACAQVIPPKEWRPCENYDGVDKFNIDTPVSQLVSGQQGLVPSLARSSLVHQRC